MAGGKDGDDMAGPYRQYLDSELTGTRPRKRQKRVKQNEFNWLNQDSKDWESGKPLPSRIVVIGEDGLGDEIFYVRFARALAEQCKGGVTWIPNWKEPDVSENDNSRLLPLFQNSFHDCRNLSFRSFRENEIPGNEELIFSKELLKYFRKDDWTHHSQLPYLSASSAPTEQLRGRYRKDGKKIVGLAWKSEGGKPGKDASLKSHPGWENIFAEDIKDRCSFLSLQYGDTQDDLNYARYRYGVEIYQDHEVDIVNDPELAAAQINACDLIISISTTAAHLAGALGKRTLLLLPENPMVHWKFPGAYPAIENFENLSLDKAALRLREIFENT